MSEQIETNLYDLNKGLMIQMKPFDVKVAKEILVCQFKEKLQEEIINQNYMLLAVEERDFTVFRFEKLELDLDKMADEIIAVLQDRGVIKDVTLQKDGTVDIWVDGKFYKLFGYDWGVIEI